VSVAYLASLLVASGALVLLDRRFALVFWRDARRATVVIIVGLAFFLCWDVAGIALGVFARGRSPFMTGVELAPDLPLEEPVFLAFLCYLTLILLFGVRAVLDRAAGRHRRAMPGRSGHSDESDESDQRDHEEQRR
jgi:lycopene cyclase domain-containing protein